MHYTPLCRLFVKLVADALNELAYPADLAGLVYGVTNSQAGFQVWRTRLLASGIGFQAQNIVRNGDLAGLAYGIINSQTSC
jgi:hypothetical protein